VAYPNFDISTLIINIIDHK